MYHPIWAMDCCVYNLRGSCKKTDSKCKGKHISWNDLHLSVRPDQDRDQYTKKNFKHKQGQNRNLANQGRT